MNVMLKGDLFVAGKRESQSQDGKTTFYSLAVVTPDGDAGNLSCSDNVYGTVTPMRNYTLTCVYRDGQYKGMRVVNAVEKREGMFSTDPDNGENKDSDGKVKSPDKLKK